MSAVRVLLEIVFRKRPSDPINRISNSDYVIPTLSWLAPLLTLERAILLQAILAKHAVPPARLFHQATSLRVAVDTAQVARLRASGMSWPKIARAFGVSVGTVYAVGRAV
jgi:Helix-turn-helix domain of resolvase